MLAAAVGACALATGAATAAPAGGNARRTREPPRGDHWGTHSGAGDPQPPAREHSRGTEPSAERGQGQACGGSRLAKPSTPPHRVGGRKRSRLCVALQGPATLDCGKTSGSGGDGGERGPKVPRREWGGSAQAPPVRLPLDTLKAPERCSPTAEPGAPCGPARDSVSSLDSPPLDGVCLGGLPRRGGPPHVPLPPAAGAQPSPPPRADAVPASPLWPPAQATQAWTAGAALLPLHLAVLQGAALPPLAVTARGQGAGSRAPPAYGDGLLGALPSQLADCVRHAATRSADAWQRHLDTAHARGGERPARGRRLRGVLCAALLAMEAGVPAAVAADAGWLWEQWHVATAKEGGEAGAPPLKGAPPHAWDLEVQWGAALCVAATAGGHPEACTPRVLAEHVGAALQARGCPTARYALSELLEAQAGLLAALDWRVADAGPSEWLLLWTEAWNAAAARVGMPPVDDAAVRAARRELVRVAATPGAAGVPPPVAALHALAHGALAGRTPPTASQLAAAVVRTARVLPAHAQADIVAWCVALRAPWAAVLPQRALRNATVRRWTAVALREDLS